MTKRNVVDDERERERERKRERERESGGREKIKSDCLDGNRPLLRKPAVLVRNRLSVKRWATWQVFKGLGHGK